MRAHEELWPSMGLAVQNEMMDFQQVFGRDAPHLLEIGFGSGQSLLAAAEAFSHCDFIGVETHKPGIGALLLGIQQRQLKNLRVFYADVIDVLEKCIPQASLDGMQIFFPDPWPKRRHHPRRLIQSEFVKRVAEKLKIGGTLHLATDWEDYARHMMKVISLEPSLRNFAGNGQFSTRSCYRPIISKFEQRALREGRAIRDIQLGKL